VVRGERDRTQRDLSSRCCYLPVALTNARELEGKVTDNKIGAIQVWQKQDGSWKLLARASYRLRCPGSRPNLVRPRTQVSTRVASIRSTPRGTGLSLTQRWRDTDSKLLVPRINPARRCSRRTPWRAYPLPDAPQCLYPNRVKGGCSRQVDGTAGLPPALKSRVRPDCYAWCQEPTFPYRIAPDCRRPDDDREPSKFLASFSARKTPTLSSS
jgi:hypothetical protein